MEQIWRFRKQGARRGSRARRKETVKASTVYANLLTVGQLPRQCGEAEMPTSNQPPCVDQGRRLLGPAALRTCPLALPRSQARARVGPGGYCQRSENGGPLTCLLAAHDVAPPAAPYGPSSSTQAQHPREGPSLVGEMTRSFLRHGLTRLAREGQRDQGKANLARFQ